MGEKIGGQILILYNADRFSKNRKLHKKCGPDKVKNKDLIPLVNKQKKPQKFITSTLLQAIPLPKGGKRNRRALRSPTPCKE